MNLKLDFRSGVPIYLQIVDQIKEMIADGRLKRGEQLPTVRALAQELRINFNTVARAYRILDESGIISTQQGRGTYILDMPPPEVTQAMRQTTLEALTDRYLDDALRRGFSGEEILACIEQRLVSKQNTISD
jgi:GntR family transcriptional regulator